MEEVDMKDADHESVPNGHSNDVQEQENEREITQTDHLNKRLLGAFLERLNRNEVAMLSDMNAAMENDIQESNSDLAHSESEWDNEIPDDNTEIIISEESQNKT